MTALVLIFYTVVAGALTVGGILAILALLGLIEF